MAGFFKTISDGISKAKQKAYEFCEAAVDRARTWTNRIAEKTGLVEVGKFIDERLANKQEQLNKKIYGEIIRRGEAVLPPEPIDEKIAKDGAAAIKDNFKGNSQEDIRKELAQMDKSQRVEKITKLANDMAKTWGLDSKVVVKDFDTSVRGQYFGEKNKELAPEGDTLYINASYLDDCVKENAVDVIFAVSHELNHARQYKAIQQMIATGTNDMGYSTERVIQYAINWRYYFNDGNDRRYWEQPIEADSNRMAAMVWEEYEKLAKH